MSRKRVVIIGGGQAGARAAAILAAAEESIDVTILSDELWHPYERPPLSKNCLEDGKFGPPAYVNTENFYRGPSVSLHLGVSASEIDRANQEVIASDGVRHAYDFLVIATGSRPRRLTESESILPLSYLRTFEDAAALSIQLSNASDLLVLGGGAIGTEIAAIAATRGIKVTIVEPTDRLLGRSVHPEISARILENHHRNGVDIRFGRTVADFREDGAVLSDGKFVRADFAVVAIGVVPNTELAVQAGLEVENGIVVDSRFVSSDPAILAAGDVASYYDIYLGCQHRSESWDGANTQADQVCASILGLTENEPAPPSFWTEQFGDHYQFCGNVSEGTVTFSEEVDSNTFNATLREGDRIVGVCSKNAPRDFRKISRQVRADFAVKRGSAEQSSQQASMASLGGVS